MYKILFDIDSARASSTDWLKNKLFLELSEQHFHYVVMDSKNELVKLKYYRLDATNQQELTEVVEQIMNNEHCFKKNFRMGSIGIIIVYMLKPSTKYIILQMIPCGLLSTPIT